MRHLPDKPAAMESELRMNLLRMNVALIAAAALLAACWQADPEPARLVAMSFNIRLDNPADGPDRWANRRERVAATIAVQAPDVVGLQEVLLHQQAFLSESLPDYGHYGAGRDDGQQKGESTPVFFRKDRFAMLDQGTFWLSETPGTPGSVGWDAAITRICSWVLLQEFGTDKRLYVFNTHFDHIGEQARVESAALIRRKIAEIAGTQPWVLLGDFNSAPGSAAYRRLTDATGDMAVLIDTYTHAEQAPAGPDSTWNGFSEIEPGRRIDYVFTGKRIRPLSLDILVDQRDGRFSSDHLPIVATLEW